MTRAARYIVAISVWVVLAVMVPPLLTMPTVGAEGGGGCVAAAAVRVTTPAYLRAGPATSAPILRSVAAPTVLGVLGHDDVAGACWYQVRDETVAGGDAWISSVVVTLEPVPSPVPPATVAVATPSGVAESLPATSPAIPRPTVAPPLLPPLAPPSPVPLATITPAAPAAGLLPPPQAVPASGSAAPFVETLPTPAASELAAHEHDHEDEAIVPVARALVIRVCLDVNENQHCDADEGIGGMPWVVQDGVTGQVLDAGITDYTGTAQRSVLVRADRGVTVNIPYLGTVDTYSGTNVPRPRPVQAVPNIPSAWP